jgi:chromosome segregation ATPase
MESWAGTAAVAIAGAIAYGIKRWVESRSGESEKQGEARRDQEASEILYTRSQLEKKDSRIRQLEEELKDVQRQLVQAQAEGAEAFMEIAQLQAAKRRLEEKIEKLEDEKQQITDLMTTLMKNTL